MLETSKELKQHSVNYLLSNLPRLDDGLLLMIENSQQAFARQNACRESLGLPSRSPSEFNHFLDEARILPELERLFDRLADGGEVFMPLAGYGFSTRFGWVGDRHGVTWQLNLP